MTDPTNPAATTDQDATSPAAATDAPPPADQSGAAQPPAEQATDAAAPKASRPDFIPEKFWDAEAGAPRLEDMAKSYRELEQYRVARTERVPEDYALPQPLQPFVDQIGEQQIAELKALAKAEGYSQQGFEHLLKWAYGDPAAHLAELKQEFGDQLDATLEACRLYARTFGDHEQAVRQLCSTAAGVKFLNAMRLKSGDAPLPGQPGEGGSKLTEAELRSKMNDPRYWRDRDPAFVAEVERGFQQLYPGGVRTAPVNPGEQPGAPV